VYAIKRRKVQQKCRTFHTFRRHSQEPGSRRINRRESIKNLILFVPPSLRYPRSFERISSAKRLGTSA